MVQFERELSCNMVIVKEQKPYAMRLGGQNVALAACGAPKSAASQSCERFQSLNPDSLSALVFERTGSHDTRIKGNASRDPFFMGNPTHMTVMDSVEAWTSSTQRASEELQNESCCRHRRIWKRFQNLRIL